MIKPNEAPMFAGIAINTRQSTKTRLACAEQALEYYVDQADKLDELLEYLRSRVQVPGEYGYADAVDRLAKIVEGDE